MASFIIKSKHGEFTVIIDDEDMERVSKHGWSISKKDKDSTYIRVESRINKKLVRLHRFILNLEKDDKRVVDHINHNTFDNRKCNLRICTQAENMRNFPKKFKNKTGFIGVYKQAKSESYRACISIKDKTHHIGGSYPTAKEAAIARDIFVKNNFPEFGVLNFEEENV